MQVLDKDHAEVIAKLTSKLVQLGVPATPSADVTVGPVLSIFRFTPSGATRVTQLENLSQDFSVILGREVLAKRMPGDTYVSVFVPNAQRSFVRFKDTFNNFWLRRKELAVPLNLGITMTGAPLVEDLAELPHFLIAGTTGSGKSTLMNTIICSIIATKSPNEVQLVVSDTKGVEFTAFSKLPHLMYPIATSAEQSFKNMEFLVEEMNTRLSMIGKLGWKNIHEYNKAVHKPLPFIVMIVDELADVLAHKGEGRGQTKIATETLNLLAQKARASGIHLLAGTQRPSVNIVSGSIKANFPARLSFRLPSDIDSRTVLGTNGAEHLLSKGDMLYVSPHSSALTRSHAPFTTQSDVASLVELVEHGLYKYD
jgi:S-DNA-T family DNA segregation ATPase FtsK/SpoIIIE